jgi:DNA ligase-1
MKASKAEPEKMRGMYLRSIKYDGMRAYWDGGLFRQNNPLDPRATGLWTGNAKPIFAPEWWLADLPPYALDGELWAGTGRHQSVTSTCRRHEPVDEAWRDIQFVVFDSPAVFQSLRIINTDNCKLTISASVRQHYATQTALGFSALRTCLGGNYWFITPQDEFDCTTPAVAAESWARLRGDVFPSLIEAGHEGIVFRRSGALWEPTRSKAVLKLKPCADAEGIVRGYTGGRNEGTVEGRWFGMLGSLLVEMADGKQFLVSHFPADLRHLNGDATKYDGTLCGPEISSDIFPLGSKVTYKYRELTDAGIPKEARYYRMRDDE